MGTWLTRRRLAAGAVLAGTGMAGTRPARGAGDAIRIGMVATTSGSAAETGALALNGARLALDEVNAQGVLGRKLDLVTEDDQTSNSGGVLAFTRLSGDPAIVAFLGPARSTEVLAMAPDVMRTARPFMFGGSDPSLTTLGNRWLFRCRPNDTYSARVMAAFGAEDLAGKRWAVVHSTDTFGSNGAKALVAALDARGIKPVLVQGYTNGAVDYTAVVLAIRQSGADLLASYITLDTDSGIFARQLRQLGVQIPWVGSASITSTTGANLAGRALEGAYGVTDYAQDATPASQAFGERFRAKYNKQPDFQSAWPYDAVHLLARAMRDAGSTDPEAIRSAMLAMRGYAGAEGDYAFNDKGDGLRAYNVVRNTGGAFAFSKRIAVQD